MQNEKCKKEDIFNIFGEHFIFYEKGGNVFQKGDVWSGGRKEVRWRPGQEASLAPRCSKLSSFGSKCTVLKKVFVTLLGLFGAPRSDLALP